MSAKPWLRRTKPRKRDMRPPGGNWSAFGWDDDGIAILTYEGELRLTDGPGFAAWILGQKGGHVAYCLSAVGADMLKLLSHTGAVMPMLEAGATAAPRFGGECTAALEVSRETLGVSIRDLRAFLADPPVRADATGRAREAAHWAQRWRALVHDALGINLESTPAKTATRAWSRTLTGRPIYRAANRDYEFLRQGYYGGLTASIPRREDRTVYYYDISSAYTWAMKEGVPVGSPTFTTNYVEGIPGIYECWCGPEPGAPPKWMARNDETGRPFLVGNPWNGSRETHMTTTMTSMEIDAARAAGHQVYVLSGLVYYAGIGYPLTTFADKMEAWREGLTGADRAMVKSLQVSMYGKFGQRRDAQDILLSLEPPEGVEWAPYYSVDGMVDGAWQRTVQRYAPTMLPHWAAWIAARVRLRLLETIESVGWENVVYYDTDAIFTTVPIKTGTKYGDWRLVDTFTRFNVYGGKQWVGTRDDGSEDVRAAGIPRAVDRSRFLMELAEATGPPRGLP